MSIDDLADLVVEDLRGDTFSKCASEPLRTRPAYDDLLAGQTAICIRRGENDEFDADYHLARLFYETENEYGDAWRHKPGSSYILQFNNYPTNSVTWVGEGYYEGYGPFLFPDGLEYVSTIRYIIYADDCNFGSPVCTDDYHQGATHYFVYTKTCRLCGAITTYTVSEFCDGANCGGSVINALIKEELK